MAALEYDKLNKLQKLAVLLVTVGRDSAVQILQHFEHAQIETITREIAQLEVVDAATQHRVLNEFGTLIARSGGLASGGPAFVEEALQRLPGRGSGQAAADVRARLRQMPPRQLLALVKEEQPQTVAFIMSCLEPALAAKVLAGFPGESREEILESLGAMEDIPAELAEKVLSSLVLNGESETEAASITKSGGVSTLAELLAALDRGTRKELLGRLEERNPTLGVAVRKILFSFDDLTRLETADLMRIVREVETSDVALALKGARPALLDAITKGLSNRAAEGLREEIDMVGKRKPKEIEAAQDKIILVARRLEEAGDITLEIETEADAPA